MIDLIVVGAGDHYNRTLLPSIEVLQRQGHARLLAVVGLGQTTTDFGALYLAREAHQPLSELLKPLSSTDPIVYLAHAHNWHTRDTLDLAQAGFRVAVEKPYAISAEELRALESCIQKSRVFLAEYYLMTEAAPLLRAAGMLPTDSFLQREPAFFVRGSSPSLSHFLSLADTIGAVRFVHADILEGEGDTGRFEHRGAEFADRRKGGGVIMDLGVHAIAPLAALAPMIGNFDPRLQVVQSAVSEDFLYHASSLGIPLTELPETYSSVSLLSTSGVPLTIAVAKYAPRNRNQRRIIFVGDAGEAILDMSTASLYVAHGDACPELAWRVTKNHNNKYVPVLRSIIEMAEGRSTFAFDANQLCLASQKFTLEWCRASNHSWPTLPTYPTGSEPREITKIIESKRGRHDNF